MICKHYIYIVTLNQKLLSENLTLNDKSRINNYQLKSAHMRYIDSYLKL